MSSYALNQEIDLFYWPGPQNARASWSSGRTNYLHKSLRTAGQELMQWAREGSTEYVLLWSPLQELPSTQALNELVGSGADAVHCGLTWRLDKLWPNLDLVVHNWSMLNAPADQVSTNWRLSLGACLLRREMFLQSGGLDASFRSLTGAGLEFGYRCLKLGAIIEHHPRLWPSQRKVKAPDFSSKLLKQDFYRFMVRHYGMRWARYTAVRCGVANLSLRGELSALRHAVRTCAQVPAPESKASSIWCAPPAVDNLLLQKANVSAIIPTLGRYPYLPEAIDSLRSQSIVPREVIVIDQNPPEARNPQVYESYSDLNLRVIWQDETG